jgi:hypothetical protein
VKGPAADATDALQPWGLLCNPMMKMKVMMMIIIIIFCSFPSNRAPVEWNWQGKTEELGEKPVLVPFCPPQIPQGLTPDRTWASPVGGRRLTAWAMARPLEEDCCLLLNFNYQTIYLYTPLSWCQYCVKLQVCNLWRTVIFRRMRCVDYFIYNKIYKMKWTYYTFLS